jgi:hypothetical protein
MINFKIQAYIFLIVGIFLMVISVISVVFANELRFGLKAFVVGLILVAISVIQLKKMKNEKS